MKDNDNYHTEIVILRKKSIIAWSLFILLVTIFLLFLFKGFTIYKEVQFAHQTIESSQLLLQRFDNLKSVKGLSKKEKNNWTTSFKATIQHNNFLIKKQKPTMLYWFLLSGIDFVFIIGTYIIIYKIKIKSIVITRNHYIK